MSGIEQATARLNAACVANEELRDRLAIQLMDGTEDEKRRAAETIVELRARVRALEGQATLFRAERDRLQWEALTLRRMAVAGSKALRKARAKWRLA